MKREMQILNRGLKSGKVLSLALLLAGWVTVVARTVVFPQGREASEYQIKAAFLYNFAKFVEWPSEAPRGMDDPITICIVGEDPFGSLLDESIRNKAISGHQLVVRRLKPGQDIKGCQIAFISSSEKKHLRAILESLKGAAVLTVGDSEGFAQVGGVINFTLEETRVHFEVNLGAAQRAGLRISSKLLSLAKIVRDQDHGGKS
jgi:hypothetical protein